MRTEILRFMKKAAMLGAILIMVLALCSCRQRLSNNEEVGNTFYDPDGTKAFDYQYRRDELGLSTAKRPIFPDWGYSEVETEDTESYEYTEEVTDFEDTASREDEEYDDEDHSTTRRTGNKGNKIRHLGRTGRGESTKGTIKVTLDPNSGTLEDNEVYVTKGKVYGSLPEPEYVGHSFIGWFTEKNDGTEVVATTKVETDKAHTLYAHWKEANTYTVTFDPNGGTLVDEDYGVMEISANSKYQVMPKVQRAGYVFDGWFTSEDGGNLVKKGDKFTDESDITLYAHWSENLYDSWENGFKDVTKDIDDEDQVICSVDNSNKDEVKSFISACKAKTGDSPEVVIKFVDKISKTDEVNKAVADALEAYPDATVLVVPNAALKGDKNEQLYYKYQVFCSLYGATFDEGTMKSDLNLKDVETIHVE